MLTVKKTLISFLMLGASLLGAQNNSRVKAVLKADPLLNRIAQADTIYVLNFWATWCKPCVQELPLFDSVEVHVKNTPVKVLLINLDFAEEVNKVSSFLQNKKIKSDCVLLDEINGNSYIDRFDKSWNGAIPATLIKKGNRQVFLERKTSLTELNKLLETF